MVNTPIKPSASSERQEVIDWLIAHNYPALPVAPTQDGRKYHKVVQAKLEQGVWTHCPLEPGTLSPVPLYTGKNPSYLDRRGIPHLVNHRQYQKRLPKALELEAWFRHQSNGVGTLGGWNNTTWLDFDVKQFPSQEECDAAVSALLERPELQQTLIERSHSGGWRIGVKVKQKPNFTNFSLTPGGPHVGEALYAGRFTVLAPTIGPSGNPYQSVQRTMPVEVESLESIGIYSTKKESGRVSDDARGRSSPSHPRTTSRDTNTPSFLPGSIPLEMLGNNTSRDILRGNCPTGDRSEALATAIQEWYGWANWGHNNGIHISGETFVLAHHAGSLLGLDSDRINRILKTIDPAACHPAALHRGGEESCWKRIARLDKATFVAKCPAHIQDAIRRDWGRTSLQNGNSGGRGSGGSLSSETRLRGSGGSLDDKNFNITAFDSLNIAAIRQRCFEILAQDLPPAALQAAKIQLRRDNPGVSEREISQLFEVIGQELDLQESRDERHSEVDNLLKLGDQSLKLSNFIPADLATVLSQLADALNIRPEVCLTSLLVAASALHKTQTELVICSSQGFSVPPTIFAGLVSESGQKKSPILKAIIRKPLSILQREKREAFLEAQSKYDEEIAAWDKCKHSERADKFADGKPQKPKQRLYYFTHTTGEGLLYQFQAHPDKALLALVDELAGLFASQNKYSGGRGSDRQDILSAFDGAGATVLRADGTKADVDGLLLSIFGTIQPEVLKQLMKDCSDPDGQWARFLFVNQPLAASELPEEDNVHFDLTDRLLKYYRAIDQLPAQTYRLSTEAYKRYRPVYKQLERLRVSHPSPGLRAVYSKMEGYIGRLAINLHVLHELSCGKRLPAPEIPRAIMEKAIALAKFYTGQVKLVHANSTEGELVPYIVKLIEHSKRLEEVGLDGWVNTRSYQRLFNKQPRAEVARSWMKEATAMGFGQTRYTGTQLQFHWRNHTGTDNDSPPFIPPPPPIEKNLSVGSVDVGELSVGALTEESLENKGIQEDVSEASNKHLQKLDFSSSSTRGSESFSEMSDDEIVQNRPVEESLIDSPQLNPLTKGCEQELKGISAVSATTDTQTDIPEALTEGQVEEGDGKSVTYRFCGNYREARTEDSKGKRVSFQLSGDIELEETDYSLNPQIVFVRPVGTDYEGVIVAKCDLREYKT